MVRAQGGPSEVASFSIPASPVVFAAAAVAQRLLARRRAGRRQCAPAGERGAAAEPALRRRGTGRRLASVTLALSSVALMAATVKEMIDAGTTLDPHAPNETTRLLTSGPFQLSRNPIYLGWAGLLAAHALWLGSNRALIPAGAFVLVMDRWQIPAEEAALSARFGSAFEAYAERVPRWLAR